MSSDPVRPPADGIVLFAHGARDPRWALTVEALAERAAALAPGTRVRTAYLEFLTPDLSDAVAALVAEGATRLRIVPVFLAAGGHLLRDLPERLEACAQRHPGVVFDLLPALGTLPTVLDAMAVACVEAPAVGSRRPESGRPDGACAQ